MQSAIELQAQHVPIILHSSSFPNQVIQTCNFQCNCACPDIDLTLSTLTERVNHTTALIQPNVHKQTLPGEHTLIFNPFHDKGVAVLNQSAVDLWSRFEKPHSLVDLFEQADDGEQVTAIQELLRIGALQPAGHSSQPIRNNPKSLSTWVHVTNQCICVVIIAIFIRLTMT